MNEQPWRAFLVDDHPAMRQVLSLLLERHGFAASVEADCAQEAMQRLPSLEIDLAVVDLSFERDKGFDLIAALHQRRIPVVVYSMHEDGGHIDRSLECGANAYISKREDSDTLLHGIMEVIQGRDYLSPRIRQAIKSRPSEMSSLPRCSERELQILKMLGEGKGNSDIAEALDLSVRTVESYGARINDKLGLSGMKELRRFAILHFRSLDDFSQ
ncbi:MAG: two component transcriptional regulator, LuxR family [Burkholderiaceae bacterium]|nr:two component transcriptional regulator, LuxR family [Burkholderiaceae bacterium]